jgi:uncharacterized protein (TIGR02145 family)
MAENLNYDAGDGSWEYDNLPQYGRLYQWDVALNACPPGWHLPTDEEWKELELFLGMSISEVNIQNEWRGTIEGRMLKSDYDWMSGGNGTNESGFTALPGDCMGYGGSFDGKTDKYEANFWTSTPSSDGYAIYRRLYYNQDNIYRGGHNTVYSFNIRCVQD